MSVEKRKTIIFWQIIGGLLSLLIVGGDLEGELISAKGRGLIAFQHALQWFFLDSFGRVGTVFFFIALGFFVSFITWPNEPQSRA